jgi:hypothetical protein
VKATGKLRRALEPLRRRPVRILEIGVGGFDDPHAGGASPRMWKHYFPRGLVCGIDIHEKRLPPEARIRIHRGSQTVPGFLGRVVGEMGGVDIVIDDGSHLNADVIRGFEILFPRLSEGGIYAVEDLQTAYWPHMGGDSADLANPATSMNYFKRLADGLNHAELLRPGYLEKHVTAVHFFHNLVFVEKGRNDEPSNIVREGRIAGCIGVPRPHLKFRPVRDDDPFCALRNPRKMELPGATPAQGASA